MLFWLSYKLCVFTLFDLYLPSSELVNKKIKKKQFFFSLNVRINKNCCRMQLIFSFRGAYLLDVVNLNLCARTLLFAVVG